MAPAALAQVLRPLQQLFNHDQPPELLVGLGPNGDDAAVYRVTPEQAIISTIDFFTPVVDDPYDYGAIAAANAMSDIYAMGGEVVFALNVGAFPASLPPEMIAEILRGGAEKVIEAGGVIAGGHTITDDEPKYGLAVTGLVHPDRFWTKGGARPGDVLVLTKPLGTGVISTALKGGQADPAHVAGMVASMKQLNRQVAQAGQSIFDSAQTRVGGIKAATDITGFGLLGHAQEMAAAADCRFVFEMSRLPLLDGALIYAAEFLFPGGMANNKMHFEPHVSFDPAIPEHHQWLLWDPQTSGGLLLAIPPDRLTAFEQACQERRQPVWVVGRVMAGHGIEVQP
jgi:selenide, water dikinase